MNHGLKASRGTSSWAGVEGGGEGELGGDADLGRGSEGTVCTERREAGTGIGGARRLAIGDLQEN